MSRFRALQLLHPSPSPRVKRGIDSDDNANDDTDTDPENTHMGSVRRQLHKRVYALRPHDDSIDEHDDDDRRDELGDNDDEGVKEALAALLDELEPYERAMSASRVPLVTALAAARLERAAERVAERAASDSARVAALHAEFGFDDEKV